MRTFLWFLLFNVGFGLNAQTLLTIEQIMQGPDFVGHLPENMHWSGDGKTIYFQWNRDTLPDAEWYKYELSSSLPVRLTVDEVKDLEPTSILYSSDRRKKLYEKEGDLFLVMNGKPRQITKTIQREIPHGFSGDEKWVIFEMGDNLFSWSIEDGTTEQLTQFKKGNTKTEDKSNAKATWLKRDQLEYFEVLRERKEDKESLEKINKKYAVARPKEIFLGKKNLSELRFSPDLNYIFYRLEEMVTTDPTIVPDYVTEEGYTQERQARSKVGGEQPNYETWIYDRRRDTVMLIDISQIPGIFDKPEFLKDYHRGPEPYVDTFEIPRPLVLVGPVFNQDGRHSVLVARSVDHKDRWIMELDPGTGKLNSIIRQHDEAWIGGPGVGGWSFTLGEIGFIDHDRLWFQSEESGYSHIYIYSFKDGKVIPLTQGKFEILGAKLSHDKKSFFIYSNRENPFEHHYYQLTIADQKWTKITGAPGDYQVVLSEDEKRMAVLYSYSNKPTELYWMENKAGAPLQQITKSTTEDFAKYPWRDPEIIHFKARDGVMVPARIYEPRVSQKNGAAIIFVHGAGYLHNVHKYWSTYYREFMFHNFLADQGYTVLDIDYRGSAGYGRDWRTAIYRHMGGKDLDDQVDGANYLAVHKSIDPQRIGIYGGSYGGFITLMALCTSPGTFKCGAALRSVTDWAHYNHGYTSNILNTPTEDSIAYYRSSPIYHADGLEGDLVMLHGMIDLNVHFQDVVRMSQRFIELGKENWEIALFPMEDHGFVEASSWTDEYKRIFRLFESSLKASEK